jgi:hypothetical protein
VAGQWAHWPACVPPGIRTTTLVHENALLAVPDRHPLAQLESVPLDNLRGQVWASCPPGTDPHEALVQLLRSHGSTVVDVRYWVADYATQLQLVAAVLATALIPGMAAVPLGVRLIPCRPTVTRTVAVTTVQGAEAPPVKAFLAEMMRAAHNAGPWSPARLRSWHGLAGVTGSGLRQVALTCGNADPATVGPANRRVGSRRSTLWPLPPVGETGGKGREPP